MQLNINHFSGIYQLEAKQVIDAPLDEVWHFFSSPKNLDAITPKEMSFEITSHVLDRTYQGQIITYNIEILPKIKSAWVTEITRCDDKKIFVDEQRLGPYAMWHHEHHFEETQDGKILMTDMVSFKLPMGWFGNLIAGRMIVNKVKSIFEYRFKVIDEIFHKASSNCRERNKGRSNLSGF